MSRNFSLLRRTRGEVALAGADLVSGVDGVQVNGAEGAVLLEVCWAVDEEVLAAELLFDAAKAVGDFFDAGGIEGTSAGGIGYGL